MEFFLKLGLHRLENEGQQHLLLEVNNTAGVLGFTNTYIEKWVKVSFVKYN